MPTYASYYYGLWEKDPKLWERCKKSATAQMVAEGWKTYARKFDRVMQKRAMELWHASA